MTTSRRTNPHSGQWKKGQSGNPKGRTPGVGQLAELRAAIAQRVPDVLHTLLAKALEGDVGAARLLLERTIPPLKAVEPAQQIVMPDGTLTEQGRAVLAAVAAGELAPGQGAALVGAIGGLARVVEVDELAARVAALEAKQKTA